jgi:hypothetical protein
MLEVAASSLLIAFMTINLIAYQGETNCGGFRTWLFGSMGIYVCDLIMSMNQLMQVKKNKSENLWLIATMVVILTVNTSWYIYGNVIFYGDYDTCIVTSEEYPNGQNPGLGSTMRFMIFIGYVTMCKCCMILLIAAIGIPCLISAYRS